MCMGKFQVVKKLISGTGLKLLYLSLLYYIYTGQPEIAARDRRKKVSLTRFALFVNKFLRIQQE